MRRPAARMGLPIYSHRQKHTKGKKQGKNTISRGTRTPLLRRLYIHAPSANSSSASAANRGPWPPVRPSCRRKDSTARVALSPSKIKAILKALGCFHSQSIPMSLHSVYSCGQLCLLNMRAFVCRILWFYDCPLTPLSVLAHEAFLLISYYFYLLPSFFTP